ncbi:phosphoesterase [Methanocella sp. CWC-04]|uniref:Phosphoesterase n=1 Tax=Methanooceanicella nereidis TaxID=2052831 RepID=A0AAP2RAE1_9EURY|nr:metallophosphoesterase [Methanocella sp. CWC-04]MCD1293911.1 phosphoesterase [Methanocella sp. CWC-04]
MTPELIPLIDSPALEVKNEDVSLVIADIHLGIEYDLYYSGINIPSQIAKRIDRVRNYIAEVGPDRIILLGDIKHNVPRTSYQEVDEVPRFLNELAKHAIVDIIPGNHDGGIEKLIPDNPDIDLHDPRGAEIDGVSYFHGHTWPDVSLLKNSYLVMSHNHPTIKLTDALGHTLTRQSWIRAKLDRDIVAANYPGEFDWGDPELIIVPSFNELCGGIAFNESWHDDLLGPLFTSKAVHLEESQVYLLDGTYMGTIDNLRKYSREKYRSPSSEKKIRRRRKKSFRP